MFKRNSGHKDCDLARRCQIVTLKKELNENPIFGDRLMLKFFTRLFAIIGVLFTIPVVLAFFALNFNFQLRPKLPDRFVIKLDMQDVFPEDVTPTLLSRVLGGRQQPFIALIQGIEQAKKDDRVKGIVLCLGQTSFGAAQLEELRAALARFKETGKYIAAYSKDLSLAASGRSQLYLGSIAHQIMLQNYSALTIEGIEIDQPFFKKILDEFGVDVQILTRKEYKSAFDFLKDERFSAPAKEALKILFDRIYDFQTQVIAQGREMSLADFKHLVDQKAIMSDLEAKETGFVDEIAPLYRFRQEIRLKTGLGNDAFPENAAPVGEDFVDIRNYLEVLAYQKKDKKPLKRIAYITGVGAIVEDHPEEQLLSVQEVISAEDMRHQIEKAAFDDSIDALLLRLDTPGGDATAAETIRAALDLARAKGKLVYTSFGNVSASGGYWIATGCDKIFASNTTITGSIGVIFGKVTLRKTLEQFGINVDSVAVGENGNFTSMLSAFNDKQLVAINHYLDTTYSAFKHLVEEARGLDASTVEEIAKGRVWSGFDAVNIGLVDQIGGVYDTILALKAALGLQENDVVELAIMVDEKTPLEVLRGISRNLSHIQATGAHVKAIIESLKLRFGSSATLYDDRLQQVR